jgi:hypothetical protein
MELYVFLFALKDFINEIIRTTIPPRTCNACMATITYRKEKDTFLDKVIPFSHNSTNPIY